MWLYIIIITVGVSIYAFSKPGIIEKLSLKPVQVYHHNSIYRIMSHALVHSDWMHLLLNMYVLYAFGPVCEHYLSLYFNLDGGLHFLLLYLLATILSSLYSIFKYRNDAYYSAIGASGAVMAVVFTSIFFDPWGKLFVFGIPLPGIVFGALYLASSFYMGRRNKDNIGHDAHLSGAIFGFLYPIIIHPSLIIEFTYNLTHL